MIRRAAESVSGGLAELLGLVDSPWWWAQGLCAQTDPEVFFPEKGGSTREAKQVCRACPVRAECLEYALAHDERFGVWGGLSERERRRSKHDDAVSAEPLRPGARQAGPSGSAAA